MDKGLTCDPRGPWFESHHGLFSFFFKIWEFQLAVASMGGFGGSTNFQILIFMSIRSYHINIKSGVSWSLSPTLLSKITKFSPKNLTFMIIKLDQEVLEPWQWC